MLLEFYTCFPFSLFLLGVTGLSLEDTKGLTDLIAAGTPLFSRDHEKCPTQLSI